MYVLENKSNEETFAITSFGNTIGGILKNSENTWTILFTDYKISDGSQVVEFSGTIDEAFDFFKRTFEVWKRNPAAVILYPGKKIRMEYKSKHNRYELQGYVGPKEQKLVDGSWQDTRNTTCLQRPTVLKEKYNQADMIEESQYSNAPKLEAGQDVILNACLHSVKFIGNYSDFALLVAY